MDENIFEIPLRVLHAFKNEYEPYGLACNIESSKCIENNYLLKVNTKEETRILNVLSEIEKRVFNPVMMNGDEIKHFREDLIFYLFNNRIPLPHLFSRLDNYLPGNSSQKELLDYAKAFVNNPDLSKPAGMYIYGPTDSGKQHITVGIAKELFLNKGFNSVVIPDQFDHKTIFDSLGANQMWAIHSVRNYDFTKCILFNLMHNAWDNGGNIVATSYIPFSKLFDESPRLIDKNLETKLKNIFENMFKEIKVSPSNNRAHEELWYNNWTSHKYLDIHFLENQLEEAVKKEEYEKAGEIHKKMKELKNKEKL